MTASKTDKLQKVGVPGTATTLDAPGYTDGDISINVGSTSNMPGDTGFTFAIDRVETVSGVTSRVNGSYCEFLGIKGSATSITEVERQFGTAQDYPADANTRVYIPVSSTRENLLVEWGLAHADQDGTLKAGAVDNAAVLANNVVETAKVKDAAITNAKLATSTGQPGGAWESWTPSFANWTVGTGGEAGTIAYYKRIGNTIFYRIRSTLGTSGISLGSGPLQFTLPVAAADELYTASNEGYYIGHCKFLDATLAAYQGHVQLITDSQATLTAMNTTNAYGGQASQGPSVPFVWGANDMWMAEGFYEAAA